VVAAVVGEGEGGGHLFGMQLTTALSSSSAR
jgi:hypothetical protein